MLQATLDRLLCCLKPFNTGLVIKKTTIKITPSPPELRSKGLRYIISGQKGRRGFFQSNPFPSTRPAPSIFLSAAIFTCLRKNMF
jgi:hypothetical protein